jgi:hypothetical protein
VSTVAEFDDTLRRFTDDRRDNVRATHGLPGEVFAWKMALGRGRTRPDSLIVITKGGTHVACVVHVCRVIRLFPLQGDY